MSLAGWNSLSRREGGNTGRSWAQGYPRPGLLCPAGRTKGKKELGHPWGTAWPWASWCCNTSWGFIRPVLKLCSVHKFPCFCSLSSLPHPSRVHKGLCGGWAAAWGDPAQLGWGIVLNLPGKSYFHGENLQIPHSITWLLTGNRSWRKGRIHSSLCS